MYQYAHQSSIQFLHCLSYTPATGRVYLQYPPLTLIPELLLCLLQPHFLSFPNGVVYPQDLCLDLVSLEGYLVALFLRGPEVGHGEAVLEVRAKVVHPADGKGEVHAKLMPESVVEGVVGE